MNDLIYILIIVAILFIPYGNPETTNWERMTESYDAFQERATNG